MSKETPQFDKKQLLNLVNREHPDYASKKGHWDFLHETYESPRSWFEKHIFQFVREGDETYSKRKERAYRFNHTREVVDLVNKYLFKTEPMRPNDVPDYVKRFRERATRSGLSQLEFEAQASRKASIYGRVYAVIDNNVKDGVMVTKADEERGDVRLYAYLVTPLQFRDCGFDENGDFEWVLIHEVERDDNDPFESTGDLRDRYRLWTKNKWYLFESKNDLRPAGAGRSRSLNRTGRQSVELVDSGDHGLGIVPVIKCDNIESDNKYSVPALIEDIAYLDRAVANYCSNLDQIINDQTFSQLVMPAQGVLPGVGSTSGDDDTVDSDPNRAAQKRAIKLGTSQILLYDGEHGAAPAYIGPDPRQAQMVVTAIRQIINEIYHTVGLAGERTKQDNSMGIDNSSGVAKAFDFERVNALLTAKANAMQNFGNRLEMVVRAYHGESPADNRSLQSVIYHTNFDVRSLNDEMAIASNFSLLGVPMELRKHQLKEITKKLWPMLPESAKKTLEKAIEDWEDPLYTADNSVSGESSAQDPMGKKTSQGFAGELPKTGQK